MTSRSSQIVRAVRQISPDHQSSRSWNDRRTFGRSIKVCGADERFYETCQRMLSLNGISSKVVKTPGTGWRRIGPQYRIWIYE